MENKLSWQQQKDEPDAWYARFLIYLSLGKNRSLLEAENSGCKRPKKATAGAWNRAASQWKWVERVQAWDVYQAKERIKESSALQKEISLKSMRICNIFLDEVEEILKTQNQTNAKNIKNNFKILDALAGKNNYMKIVLGISRMHSPDIPITLEKESPPNLGENFNMVVKKYMDREVEKLRGKSTN